MTSEVKYEVQFRGINAFAVTRTGPRGGTKVVSVYKFADTAERIRQALQDAAQYERP